MFTPDTFAKYLGISKSTLWRIAKTDPDFPPPIRLTPRTLRWAEEAVHRYTQKKGVRYETARG